MHRHISLIIVAILLYLASVPVFAESVHKWVDEKGVTHYSDHGPASSTVQVTLIEVPATYSTTATNVEKDYYSITNQWMRLHQERLEREKIKLEKAKQRAAQQPVAPQIIYVNEPERDRYVVAYPRVFHRNFKHHRRLHHKRNGGKHAIHHRRGNSVKLYGQDRRHKIRSRRNAAGLTLDIR